MVRPGPPANERHRPARVAVAARIACSLVLVVAMAGNLACRRSQGPDLRIGPGRFSTTDHYSPVGAKPTTAAHLIFQRAAVWQRAAEADPSISNIRRLGVAHALVANLDESIRVLEELESAWALGHDATTLSDLAAAHLARYEATGDFSDVARALNHAEEAVTLDPSSAPAWFNVALAQGLFGMRARAIGSWEQHDQLERDHGWREEASAHLQELLRFSPPMWSPGQPIDRSNAHLARRWLLLEGFPRFAQDAAAADQVRRVAAALSTVTGDALWKTNVDEMLDGKTRSSTGFAALARAQLSARDDDFTARSRQLEAACLEFSREASVLEVYCAGERVSLHARSLPPQVAHQLVEQVIAVAGAKRFTFVEGRAKWTAARLRIMAGDRVGAAGMFREALALLTTSGAEPEAALVATQLADVLHSIGRNSESWVARSESVRRASVLADREADYGVLESASLYCSTLALPHAAYALAEINGWPLPERMDAVRLQRQLRAAIATGDVASARRFLAAARERLATPDARGEGMSADVDVAEGLLLAVEDRKEEAVEAIVRGLGRMGAGRDRQRTDALVWLARTELALGHLSNARAYLEDATRRLVERSARSGGADLQMEERGWLWATASALAIADRGVSADRQIGLLEAIKTWGALPGMPLAVPPERAGAVLYFVSSASQIGAWLWANQTWTFKLLECSPQDVRQTLAVLRLHRRAELRLANPDALLTELRRVLLGPFETEIAKVEALHLIPDGVLFGVPFPALRSDVTGRYLVEQTTLTFAYRLPAARRARLPESRPHEVLLVGGPTSDQAARLANASREATQIARSYHDDDVVLLSGPDATEGAFRKHLPSARVVHFAGHAVPQPHAPHRARLLFSAGVGNANDDGVLTVAELEPGMIRSAVIVLAACQTASSDSDRRFGASHLAGELIRNGAEGVVATVDDIPDDESGVYLRFHRHLAAGMPPASALRQAQVDILRGLESPQHAIDSWALALYYGEPALRKGER